MNDNKKTTEFELSFNFKNVLYIAQVTEWTGTGGEYYSIEYFSPNEKGEMKLLKSADENDANKFQEPAHAHNKDFVDEIINQINQKNFH
jgi:hypothetical protein